MKRRRTALLTLICIALCAPAAQAGFAGQNGRIYFATSKKGHGLKEDIFSMTPRGTDIRRVADLRGGQREPGVSPDAGQLAFWSYGTDDPGLWTMGADGSDPALLADSSTNTQPAFLADGETIAYRDLVNGPSEQSDEHIFTVAADGSPPGATPLLADPGERYRFPTFSADGELMAFVQADETPATQSWNVYVADADGTNRVPVVTRRTDDYAPDISPDGERIVFWSRARGELDIFSVRIDGTRLRRLTGHNGVNEWMPDYSPNGNKIVYMRERGKYPDIFKMNANGSHPRALTHFKRRALQPDWATKPTG